MRIKNTGLLKQFLIRPGHFLYRKLPPGLRSRLFLQVQTYFKMRKIERKEDLNQKSILFLEEEISMFFWGLLITFIVSAVLLVWAFYGDKSIVLSRNPFGGGQKEQELLLKDGHGKKTVSVTIEEQQISEKEIQAIFQRFFKDLEQHMCGENDTLSNVNHPLRFDDCLDPYPFEISYQPDEPDLVGLDGQLGETVLLMKKDETRETGIKVTAVYKEWEKSRIYSVVLMAPGHEKRISVYDRAKEQLALLEKDSRYKKIVTFPGQIDDILIQMPGSVHRIYGLVFLVLMIPVFVVIHRYYDLKEKARKRQKESEEDFPVIVHLLTLYMKAGLSFSSAVHRISRNYTATLDESKGRYAFDEIVWMDRQMQMGVSQKEACAGWGQRSQDNSYRKLSVALIQLLSKGSREADRILEHMEKDAFEQRIDRARKAGKEAETRLLFPMIVLLCLVMMIVLFPAVVRFQGF